MLRYGEEDHVKGLAVFLASKASDFMTGAIIPLDGGMAAK
jgi:2-deoxy-D-gluconate 3-dehydrogenase